MTRVLFIQTEDNTQTKKAIEILRNPKVVPGARIVVLCRQDRRTVFESLPQVEEVLSYQSGELVKNIKLIWDLTKRNAEVVAAIFSARPVYRFQKLLFFVLPVKHRLVFNVNLDCDYLRRDNFYRLIFGAKPKKPRILFIQTESFHYVSCALRKLKGPQLFPYSEVLLLCREEDQQNFAAIEQIDHLRIFPATGLRGTVQAWKELRRYGAHIACAILSGGPTCRWGKLLFFLSPARRRLVFNAQLECCEIWLCTSIYFLRNRISAAHPRQLDEEAHLQGTSAKHFPLVESQAKKHFLEGVRNNSAEQLVRLLNDVLVKEFLEIVDGREFLVDLYVSLGEGQGGRREVDHKNPLPDPLRQSSFPHVRKLLEIKTKAQVVIAELARRSEAFSFSDVLGVLFTNAELDRIRSLENCNKIRFLRRQQAICFGEQVIRFDPEQYEILRHLARHVPDFVPVDEITQVLRWNFSQQTRSRIIEHISTLNRKLKSVDFFASAEFPIEDGKELGFRFTAPQDRLAGLDVFAELMDLPKTAWVLDLGAGSGSFPYHCTNASVLALDLTFPSKAQPAEGRVMAEAQALPLKDRTIDLVICNHSLEHFDNVEQALAEINRVAKGFVWGAVPDASSFDDRMYRFLFDGGGHVNRFTLDSFVRVVEENTELRACSYKKLYTGFVYLYPPRGEVLIHYPSPAKLLLSCVSPKTARFALRWLNYFVRRIDRYFQSQLSLYGWGVVFYREAEGSPDCEKTHQLKSLPTEINVCFSCGRGFHEGMLTPILRTSRFFRAYICPSCGRKNLFFRQSDASR